MSNLKFDVVIVGGGVAGLSAAWRLLSKNKSLSVCIIEKDLIGGKCRTLLSNRSAFDVGGHFLHSFDQFPEELHCLFNSWSRFTKKGLTFDVDGKMYFGPIQKHFDIPVCDVDYSNLESFYKTKFGLELYKKFFGPYNEKLLNTSLSNIKPPLKIDVRAPKPSEKSYNDSFLYPKNGGIQSLTDGLFNLIKDKLVVLYDYVTVFYNNKVSTKLNGNINYDVLIVTSSIRDNLKLEGVCPTVQVINGFGVPKLSVSEWTWAYLASKSTPFFRIGNYSGCGSSKMGNRIPFYAESGCEINYNLIKNSLSSLFDDIIIVSSQKVNHAYPVYVNSDEKIKQDFIEESKNNNVYWAGRYGKDEWFSVAETLTDSINVADEIIIAKL